MTILKVIFKNNSHESTHASVNQNVIDLTGQFFFIIIILTIWKFSSV